MITAEPERQALASSNSSHDACCLLPSVLLLLPAAPGGGRRAASPSDRRGPGSSSRSHRPFSQTPAVRGGSRSSPEFAGSQCAAFRQNFTFMILGFFHQTLLTVRELKRCLVTIPLFLA